MNATDTTQLREPETDLEKRLVKEHQICDINVTDSRDPSREVLERFGWGLADYVLTIQRVVASSSEYPDSGETSNGCARFYMDDPEMQRPSSLAYAFHIASVLLAEKYGKEYGAYTKPRLLDITIGEDSTCQFARFDPPIKGGTLWNYLDFAPGFETIQLKGHVLYKK